MKKLLEITNSFDTGDTGLRWAIFIGLWCAMLAAVVNIRSISNDNVPNVLIPASLLCEGNLELGEFRPLKDGYQSTECYWAVETKQGLFSRYPIWAGVAATPIFAPFVVAAELFNLDSSIMEEKALLRIGRLATLIFTAVFAGTMAWTLRRFMPGSWAALLTVFAVLGTTLWHNAFSQLSNQTVPVTAVMLLLAILSLPEMTQRRALAAGVLAGLVVASRPPAVFVAALPLGLFISRAPWRRYLPVVVAAGLLFPGLTLLYNAHAFGAPLTTGYGGEASERFEAPMLEGLIGLMLSPTCGLLVYSSFLLLGFALRLRLRPDNAPTPEANELARWIILGVIAQWLLMSKWWAWNGALTYGGARMMAETVPGLVLLIALQWPTPNSSTLHKRGLRAAPGALLITGAFSVLLYLVGTVAYDAIAPTNPDKLNWDIRQDFIVLYLHSFGTGSLLVGTLKHGAMLLGTFLIGGYLVSRFLTVQHTQFDDDPYNPSHEKQKNGQEPWTESCSKSYTRVR
ncbi:MAG: hypothetical protein MI923_30260 [Phycisphaerales bacterium]|nr:hypothetical protein [Phycisphaerales bacterium]